MDAFDQTADDVPALGAEAVADALDVLDDLLEWRLASARWERVRDLLDALAAALRSHDPEAAQEAVAELELAGPVRVTRIGTKPLLPPSEDVRDRRNRLVHALGEVRSGQRRDGEKPGTRGRDDEEPGAD
ncbi:CATRA system-associated protein [Nonomuraea sp. NPDC049646]|uniref:CATRA system-associated protein n=1 Tax=unclassified Nonomuraea TaxID=2593643 RepID=UPI0037B8924C